MRRRGLCLTPFAPQRIVAVTRARWGFYRRPRAFPRRPSASSRDASELATRGAGLAVRLRCGKGRARPEETVAAVRSSGGGDKQPEGGGARGDRGRARGVRGAAHRSRRLRPPRRGSCNPAPPSPPCRESAPRPSAPGSPSGTAAKGGAGPIAAVRIGMLLPWPEKTPCPFRVISPECWLCLSNFSGGRLALGDQSLPVLLGAGTKKIR